MCQVRKSLHRRVGEACATELHFTLVSQLRLFKKRVQLLVILYAKKVRRQKEESDVQCLFLSHFAIKMENRQQAESVTFASAGRNSGVLDVIDTFVMIPKRTHQSSEMALMISSKEPRRLRVSI